MAVTALFKADFSSFFDAVQQADVELKTLDSGAGNVQGSLNRLADAFSGRKMIQDATLAAEAINQIGGASVLTENEQAKVNAKVQEAIEKYQVLGQQAPQALIDLADATKQTASSTEVATAILGSFFAQYLSGEAVIGSVKEAYAALTEFVHGSLDVFGEAEAAERRLTVAVQTQGDAIPDLADQYLALGKSYEQTTAFSHTAIDAAEALFVQLGNVGPEMMGKAIQAATDLSSGLGIDLNSAVTLLSKAFEGHTTALGRYGIVLDQTRVQAEGMGYVLEAIEGKVGGQAQGELDTYAGKVKQLGNAWDDAKEKVGEYIAQDQIFQAALRDAKDAVDGNATSGNTLTTVLGTLADAVIPNTVANLKILGTSAEDDALLVNTLADAMTKMSNVKPPAAFTIDAKMPDVTGAADYAKQLQEEWKKEAEEAQKAAEQTAKAIQTMESTITGADLAKKVSELNAAVIALGGAGQLTEPELERVATAADDLFKKGATLSPQLLQIALDFNGLLPPVKDTTTAMGDLGQKWTLAIPVLDSFNQGVVDMQKVTKDAIPPWSDLGGKITLTIPDVVKLKDGLLDLGKSLDTMGSAIHAVDPELGTLITDFGHVATAIDGAEKSFSNAAKAFSAGDTLTGILSMSSGIIGIASAAIEAGKAVAGFVSNLLGLGTAGRDSVVAFADTFGGFDALHTQLDALGDSGEQLWIKLTQGVGRNNPAQAAEVINEITTALNNQKTAQDAAGQTTEAQAVVTIETATQASQALDDLGVKLQQDADDWKTWSDAVNADIDAVAQNLKSLPLPGGFSLPPSGSGGGSGSVAVPGGPRVTLPGSGDGSTDTTSSIHVHVNLDGQQIAQVIVPALPSAVHAGGFA